jgi:hypothetical protein
MNPSSSWAYDPLIVPKTGSIGDQFRYCVDLRPVKNQTEAHSWPMPNREHELSRLSGATCTAKLDFIHCYWQLPLAAESQSCQSFTPSGVFTPTNVLRGITNAVMHFQSIVGSILACLRDSLISWLNEKFIFAIDCAALLRHLSTFFMLSRDHLLFLHASKCKLHTLETTCCGGIVRPAGWQFHPRRLSALLSMPTPVTAADLVQFTCAATWMRRSIPNFAAREQPLLVTLETCCQTSRSRYKLALHCIAVRPLWGVEHERAFLDIKDALASRLETSHPDPARKLCLLTDFTDASNHFWSAVLT